MTEFTVSSTVPATPTEVYTAWLSSEGHSLMTGGDAHCSDKPGASFDAWDGYISGKNISLETDRRIVQSWRTSQFADSEPDSQIEITLEPATNGTLITLHHTNVPDGGAHYRTGWQDHYFDPMKEYFGVK